MHDFLKDGKLTEDGLKVVAYLNEAIEPALKDRNPNVFNGLSGMVKDYGMNVAIAGFASTEAWIAGHPNAAEAVLELVLAKEKQQTATEAATQANEGVTKLTEEFNKLAKLIEERDKKRAEEIAALKEAQNKPADPAKKPDKKTDKSTKDTEKESEDEA